MRLLAVALPALVLAGCSLNADAPSSRPPSPLGTGLRIAQVQDPASKQYAPNTTVDVSGTVVLWVDTFDETHDGKSVGTVFVQDVGYTGGAPIPYSGISVFQPSYVPADLRLLPGDVLDFVGPYQEVTSIGTAMFTPPQTLPQLAKPVGTFRYEFAVPQPTVVSLADLNDYKKGRQWEGMLVTLNDVYLGAFEVDSSGSRIDYPILPSSGAKQVLNNVAISNELYDLKSTDYKIYTHAKSVTGLVTWFYSFHIAPRSPADIVVQ
jgi:hypothetical protein